MQQGLPEAVGGAVDYEHQRRGVERLRSHHANSLRPCPHTGLKKKDSVARDRRQRFLSRTEDMA